MKERLMDEKRECIPGMDKEQSPEVASRSVLQLEEEKGMGAQLGKNLLTEEGDGG